MRMIQLDDLRDGYVDLVNCVDAYGRSVTSRGLATRELVGVSIEFLEPAGVMLPIGVGRAVNGRLAAVEALQLMSGTGDVSLLYRASPNYSDVLVRPDHAEYGAYGPRLRYQLDSLVELLRREPDTRRAVLVIWREDDLTHDGDRPCTLTLQFLIRDDALHMIVTMRSQDVWLGVPYDVFMFSQLQRSLARQLGATVGPYVHNVGSLHLYDRDLERSRRLVYASGALPVDLPHGVASGPDDVFTETATRLVEGEFDVADAQRNSWYVRQLSRLGVGSSAQEVDA